MRRKTALLGFTLVEVMVVLAIVVLLSTMLMAGYIRFNQKRKVEEAALDFAQFLQTQQKRAISGDMGKCEFGEKLDGYEVSVITSITATSKPVCKALPNPDTVYELTGKNVFDETNFSVTFQALSQGVTINNPNTNVAEVTDSTHSFEVEVDTNGAITVQET